MKFILPCWFCLPNKDKIPLTTHITKLSPTDPEYLKVADGETKIPMPITEAIIRFTADKRFSSLFSSTVVPSVTFCLASGR